MQDRRFKLLVLWNVILTVVVIASLGANAFLAQAGNNPPVKVYAISSDDANVNGTTAGKVAITGRNNKLLSLQVDLSAAQPHYCIAVASVEIKQPAQGGRYAIHINTDEGIFPNAASRDLEFSDANDNNRNEIREVTTIFVRNMDAGNHSFYLLGTKKMGGDWPDLTIAKGIMYAICMDRPLTAS